MTDVILRISGMDCGACAVRIVRALQGLPGLREVSVSDTAGCACLTYDEMAEEVETYLDGKGVNYCHYDYDNSYIECIGCELREGTEKEFMESLEKAKKTLKAFDEEHGTNFADKAVIISDVVVDY